VAAGGAEAHHDVGSETTSSRDQRRLEVAFGGNRSVLTEPTTGLLRRGTGVRIPPGAPSWSLENIAAALAHRESPPAARVLSERSEPKGRARQFWPDFGGLADPVGAGAPRQTTPSPDRSQPASRDTLVHFWSVVPPADRRLRIAVCSLPMCCAWMPSSPAMREAGARFMATWYRRTYGRGRRRLVGGGSAALLCSGSCQRRTLSVAESSV